MRVWILLALCFFSFPVHSLTCKNDYSGGNGCAGNSTAAGDCETLGFTKENVEGCNHYLNCMFDTNYKRCVSYESPEICNFTFVTSLDPVKINSASCEKDGETYYEQICEGFNSADCPKDYNFVPKCTTWDYKTYGSCTTNCTFQYDIANYPQVKEVAKNESCTRDGITYYKELCSGVSYAECQKQNGVLSDICHTYNGMSYGICSQAVARQYKFIINASLQQNAQGQCTKCSTATWTIKAWFQDPATNQIVSSASKTINCQDVLLLQSIPNQTFSLNFDNPLVDGKTYKVYMTSSFTNSNGSISVSLNRIIVNGRDLINMVPEMSNGTTMTVEARYTPEVVVDAVLCGGK